MLAKSGTFKLTAKKSDPEKSYVDINLKRWSISCCNDNCSERQGIHPLHHKPEIHPHLQREKQ